MRLGSTGVFGVEFSSVADEWAGGFRARGFSATIWPLGADAAERTVSEYVAAAAAADLAIAEVQAFGWPNPRNPISKQARERHEAVRYTQEQLALADRVGARCCVAFSGSRAESLYLPDAGNLSSETHELLVEFAREVIDGVRPNRTYLTLEGTAKVLPDSPEAYLDLIRDVDRPQFGVHLDIANWISSPRRYYGASRFTQHCIQSLAPYVRAYHLKDFVLERQTPVSIRDAPLGEGGLDLRTFVREAGRLTPDAPVLLEHLPTDEAYDHAAALFRAAAEAESVILL